MEWYLNVRSYVCSEKGNILKHVDDKFFSDEIMKQYEQNALSAFSVFCVDVWFKLYNLNVDVTYFRLTATSTTGDAISCRWNPERGIYNVSHETWFK